MLNNKVERTDGRDYPSAVPTIAANLAANQRVGTALAGQRIAQGAYIVSAQPVDTELP